MRQVVLDTETTGLDPALGHRVIEIGAVELVNRRMTGGTFHVYLNPDRAIDAGAMAVHGITDEFLADKPRFADISQQFLEFVRGAELVIHNAPFDVGFLNAELKRLDEASVQRLCTVLDTLKLAKEIHPGQKNNLDALCKRYQVDNSGRNFHGALLDAQLLAEVYLAMTRGQESLGIDVAALPVGQMLAAPQSARRGVLKVLRASEAELSAHADYLAGLGKECGEFKTW
jgi:DNA polymerase-3 subunit epsilon